jgi:hypothetical protein
MVFFIIRSGKIYQYGENLKLFFFGATLGCYILSLLVGCIIRPSGSYSSCCWFRWIFVGSFVVERYPSARRTNLSRNFAYSVDGRR